MLAVTAKGAAVGKRETLLIEAMRISDIVSITYNEEFGAATWQPSYISIGSHSFTITKESANKITITG
jgi:thiamine monophosphate synthase